MRRMDMIYVYIYRRFCCHTIMRNVYWFAFLLVALCGCAGNDPDIPDGQSFYQDRLPACTTEVIDMAGTYARLRVKIKHQLNTSLDSIRLYYRVAGSPSEIALEMPGYDTTSKSVSEEVTIPGLNPLTSYQYRIYMANHCISEYTEPTHFTTRNAAWVKVGDMPADFMGRKVVQVANRVFLITEYIFADDYPTYAPTTKHNEIWEYDPEMKDWKFVSRSPFLGRFQCVYFGLENNIYMGMGFRRDGTERGLYSFTEWWSYDLQRDEWKQKSNFPGLWANLMTYFTAGNMGYMITEYNDPEYHERMHVYQYNPLNDTWKEKAPCPGAGAVDGSYFTIGQRAYIFTGIHGIYEEGAEAARPEYVSDMWEYDTKNDQWTRCSNFGGGERAQLTSGISIGDKGFAGGGFNLQHGERNIVNDWWCYLPGIDSWIAYPNPPTWPNFAFQLKGDLYIGNTSVGIWKLVE